MKSIQSKELILNQYHQYKNKFIYLLDYDYNWETKYRSFFVFNNKYERIRDTCYLYNIRSNKIFVFEYYIEIHDNDTIYLLIKTDKDYYVDYYGNHIVFKEMYNNIILARDYPHKCRLSINYIVDILDHNHTHKQKNNICYITDLKFQPICGNNYRTLDYVQTHNQCCIIL